MKKDILKNTLLIIKSVITSMASMMIYLSILPIVWFIYESYGFWMSAAIFYLFSHVVYLQYRIFKLSKMNIKILNNQMVTVEQVNNITRGKRRNIKNAIQSKKN